MKNRPEANPQIDGENDGHLVSMGSHSTTGRTTVEVVYNTSPETTTREAREGLLMEGLRLSTLKKDGPKQRALLY
jgi:hypothetical protein